jgi:hypothetical protein
MKSPALLRTPGASRHYGGIGSAFDQTRQTVFVANFRCPKNIPRTKVVNFISSQEIARVRFYFCGTVVP